MRALGLDSMTPLSLEIKMQITRKKEGHQTFDRYQRNQELLLPNLPIHIYILKKFDPISTQDLQFLPNSKTVQDEHQSERTTIFETAPFLSKAEAPKRLQYQRRLIPSTWIPFDRNNCYLFESQAKFRTISILRDTNIPFHQQFCIGHCS